MFPPEENFSDRQTRVPENSVRDICLLIYIEVCEQLGTDTTAQENYALQKLLMQDIHFTSVKSPIVSETKGGSACESPHSPSVFTLKLCSRRTI